MANTAALLGNLLCTNADINFYTQQQIYWSNKYEANAAKLSKQVKYEEKWENAFDDAMDTEKELFNKKSIDFKVLNDVLVERYKSLGGNFIAKLNKHREKQYFWAASEGFNFITQDYADKQINII